MQYNFGRVIPDEEIKATKEATNETNEVTKETTNEIKAKNEVVAIKVKADSTKTEAAAVKVDVPVTNTDETPTEPVEDNDKSKLPLWRAALKQKKEAEIKRRDEEQKKSVSHYLCVVYQIQNPFPNIFGGQLELFFQNFCLKLGVAFCFLIITLESQLASYVAILSIYKGPVNVLIIIIV